MSAATKIEDENIIKEAREAEVSEARTTSEGNSEPFFHKDTVKDYENGGKSEITPSKLPSEEALTDIDNADAVNKNTISESQQQMHEIPTGIKHIVGASGDSQIQSKNTTIGGQDITYADTYAEETKDDETVGKIIMEGTSFANLTEDNTSDVSSTFIDNKSVNDNDITSQVVSNDDVIKNIEPPAQCTDTKANEPVKSQSKDVCNETDSDMKIDNEDDDLELKWDDDNDDDLMKDDMECDPSNEEHAETLADESSMDVDFDDEKDLLNDNTIVKNDKNDVESTVGTTIQKSDKETDDNVQNDEKTDVINDNTTEINSNAPILNENEVKVINEPQKQLESPADEISSSQDASMEDSELINKDHGIHKPDVMLEIPTQELIDIDDTDLSINLDQSVESLDVDEKLIDNDMPVNDGEVTTVKDVELGITADTNMQENLEDLVENITEKVFDNKSEELIQPSTSCISKTTTETSEILSVVADSVVKSESSDNLGDVAQVSGSVDPIGSEGEVPEVSGSVILTVSPINMIEDSINKVSEVTDPDPPRPIQTQKIQTQNPEDPEVITSSDMPEETDNLGTLVTSDKMVPDTTSQLPESENVNPVATSNNMPEVTENLDTLVSSMTPESTDKVPETSEDMDLQTTTSNDKPEVTDTSDILVSSKTMSPDTSTKVSDPPAISHELPAMSDSIDISVSTPETTNKVPEVSEFNRDTSTSVLQVSDSIDIHVPSNKVTPETTIKLPEVSDFNPDTSTSIVQSDGIDISESSNKVTPDTTNKIPEVSDFNPDTSTSVLQVSDSIDISVSNKIIPETTNKVPEVSDFNPDTSTSVLQVSDNIDISVSNKMIPDTSDEMPEVSDSLGLLAESSRVMEDDDDQEDDDDADEDDDFDQDESSNQITTAEHSEDSNAQQSESEANKDEKETDISPPVESEREFQFMISNVESRGTDKIDMECEEPSEDVVETNEELIEDIVETDEAMEPLDEKLQVTDSQADIETVRLSDTSDNEADADTAKPTSEPTPSKITKEIPAPSEPSKQSPSKTKKLELSTSDQPVFNIVDLEESSSEDDIQEVNKEPETTPEVEVGNTEGVTSVNLPNDIEVMCTSAGSTSEIVTKEGEVVISGVPKPPPIKPARLNTSEVSIKTAGTGSESTLVIPEAKTTIKDTTSKEARVKPKLCLEIFSLDSDEEDASSAKDQPSFPAPAPQEPELPPVKCINPACSSAASVPRAAAAAAARLHYGCARKGKALICETCAYAMDEAKQNLIRGIKDFCPLLELGADKLSQELVEISDSESEDESEEPKPTSDTIGEKGAKLLEENLAAIINETWRKYNMDARMKDTHDILDAELQKLETESAEIDAMLSECQAATDRLRNELYATFDRGARELPPHVIYDTPMYNYVGPEIDKSTTPPAPAPEPEPLRQSKRRMSTAAESPAKKPAIPLGYTPLETDTAQHNVQDSKTDASDVDNKMDDDKDVSVVRLSAEAAPADLPPAGGGAAARAPPRTGQAVYAMRNSFGPWLKGKILEVQPKANSSCFTMCRVKFDHKVKNPCKILAGRCLAYPEPAEVRMTIGTRIIALYKDPSNVKREQFFSGVVAEIPNPVNNYRYLVFFDDGYAQYVQHAYTRLVCESSSLVWEEVHPFSRQFVKDYLMAYPERPMVRLHEGQSLKTEWNGKWWSARVLVVDASLAQVLFLQDGRKEWIYRGSTRLAPLYLELQAAGRHRQRPMPRSKAATGTNMPYVEYTRSDEQNSNKQQDIQTQQQQNEELRRQRAVAKKSTAAPAPPAPHAPHNLDTVTSRVVYYTPKAAVKPYKMVPHSCGPKCKRTDVLSLKELRTYNPLAKPLLSGWERQIVRFKSHKDVMYRAPCGRRLRDMRELHRYLRITQSELPVDLFDFFHGTHCLAEFVLNKCLVGKKDLSHGKENVPVPCVNYYDDSLPEFCSYNTERTPTAGVPLNLDPDFLCGCDCTDDCMDKSKCACWRMTLEGAHTIGLEGPNVGYVYKRLPEPLPSGIYECNSRCKCKATCLNRVAQHPLQLKLQVFKTLNRGWGIRALNDIPKGAFLCVYAGNLLTDATANLDGLNEGDEYLAELDYIEVVEQMKEGYEEDIPSADKRLDKKESGKRQEEEESSTSSAPSSDDETRGGDDKEDGDFQPGYSFGHGVMEFNKALRKRNKAKKEEDKGKDKDKDNTKDDEDCITISDDEEVREPSRFTAQAGMGANQFISKYRSVRSHFGKDEACYIMDAKVQGNIGRYLNHSCTPNVFVQNVFVDTHDPRFPWVAFFALSHIRAGTELTWNYNYDVGSVPGKVLYCFCGAPNCRGRLL